MPKAQVEADIAALHKGTVDLRSEEDLMREVGRPWRIFGQLQIYVCLFVCLLACLLACFCWFPCCFFASVFDRLFS